MSTSATGIPGSGTTQSTTGVAKEQAGQVGERAGEAAQQVASTSKEQAQQVATEARAQARDLGKEARAQVNEQAATQRDRLVDLLRSLGDELEEMALRGRQSGYATEMAHRLANGARDAAGRMDGRDPGDLLEQVRSFARRRPGAFLLGSAVAGVLAGRITRGAVAQAKGETELTSREPTTREPTTREFAAGPAVGLPAGTPSGTSTDVIGTGAGAAGPYAGPPADVPISTAGLAGVGGVYEPSPAGRHEGARSPAAGPLTDDVVDLDQLSERAPHSEGPRP